MTLTLQERADRANGKRIKRSVTKPMTAMERRAAVASGLSVDDVPGFKAWTEPAPPSALDRRAAAANGKILADLPTKVSALEREYTMAKRAASVSGPKALARFNDSPLAKEFEKAKARPSSVRALDRDNSVELPLCVSGQKCPDGRAVRKDQIADWSRQFRPLSVTRHGEVVAKLLGVRQQSTPDGKVLLWGEFSPAAQNFDRSIKGFSLTSDENGALVEVSVNCK